VPTYDLSKEWVHIWINKEDGSIDIQYNITLTYLSGSPQGIVRVGMPKGGFQITYVRDPSGANLQYSDVSSGSFYGIDVYLRDPTGRIILGKAYAFLVYAIVPGMVSPDSTNPGNVGMLFIPATFVDPPPVGPIGNLRVAIVLPQGVQQGEIKTTEIFYDNLLTEDSSYVVYWERSNWPATQQFRIGVSFPEKYVTLGPSPWLYIIIGAVVLAAVALIVIIFLRRRKETYEKPRIAVEALGALRGLTAVEAAVVLDVKPLRVLTMILFALLMKRRIQVAAVEPIIKVKELEPPQEEPPPSLRYYEIDYLRSIEPDGTLDDLRLAQTYLGLRDNVDRRLRGYSRADTVNYYRSVVSKAWEQVTQAGTPELRGDAIEENIEWLLTDSDFEGRFRAFPPDVIILPRPGWWWYWPRLPPTGGPLSTPVPTTTGEAKPIPIQEFANNIVKGLEQASNNIVKDVQAFTNRLVAPQQAEARSVRGASHCVCACATCACACACVGCACACAGGGAR